MAMMHRFWKKAEAKVVELKTREKAGENIDKLAQEFREFYA